MGLLDYIRDIAQGASNSVSSNVSGPVDLISWGLRKAGVPIPEAPVGGSQWMRNAGLLQDPKSHSAGLVGETLGLLAGPLAAAKAPQIAAGLLQGGENLAAAKTLNPQTGAIVWHGSPHKFDKFDSSKIGSGEGSQAYGHGLYVADNPTVANSYKAMAGNPARRQFGLSAEGDAQVTADALIKMNAKQFTGGDVGKLAELIQRKPNAFNDPDSLLKRITEYEGNNPPSFMYKVDLPDEHIAKMLDWDKPLSQQHPDVQKALSGIEAKFPEIPDFNLRKWMDADPLASTWHNALQRDLGADPAFITDTLKQRGVPGIRYLDGGSRSTGEGTSNFVVFPGNENLLQIIERNGQTLK